MKRKRSGKQNWGAMALVMVLALFLFAPNSAMGAVIVIDDMSETQGSALNPILEDDSAGPTTISVGFTTANPGHIVGDDRILEITHVSVQGEVTSTWVDDGVTHSWHLQNSDGATGWGRVVWCGSDAVADIDGVYNLALDLTSLDYFNFTEVFSDQATTFTFEVYTDATHGAQATIGLLQNETKNNVHLAKAAFTNIGAGVDWSNVTRIQLKVDQALALDSRCLEIQAITLEPDLSCTKTFDQEVVDPLDVITATVVVTNDGDFATNVDITDTLDAGLSYVANTAKVNGILSEPTGGPGGPLVWTDLGPIAKDGGTLTLTYDIRVDAIGTVPLCNYVLVESTTFPDIDTTCEDCVTHEPPPPPPGVPTFTQWGIIGFLLLLTVSGVWLTRRKGSMS